MIIDERSSAKRRSNKGLTLIELIIIVAIMGILSGYVVYNVSVTNGYRARKCKNLLATSISELKVKTLSKAVATGDIYMEVYKDGNTYYTRTHVKDKSSGADVPEEPVEIGKRISVKAGSSSSTASDIGAEGSGLLIIFNRSTGALMDKSGSTYTKSNVKYIGFIAADKSYELELVPETGKVINRT